MILTESPRIRFSQADAASDIISTLVENTRHKTNNQLMAVASWINAFTSFKQLRNRVGLPENDADWLAYGALLGTVKASGKALLSQIDNGVIDPSPIISKEALASCVSELQRDDALLDGGYLQQEDPEVAALFRQ